MLSATVALPLVTVFFCFALGVVIGTGATGLTPTWADAVGIGSLALGLVALYFAMHTDIGVGWIQTRLIRGTIENLKDRIQRNEFDAVPEMTTALQEIGPLTRDEDRSAMKAVVQKSVVPAAKYALANAALASSPEKITSEVWKLVAAAKKLGVGVDEAELDKLTEQANEKYDREVGDPGLDVGNQALINLASRYNEIRATLPPGFERTSQMTAVVQQIEAAAARTKTFDWRSALSSEDRGRRLAAYAYLYVRPQRGAGEPLAGTLLSREDKPFGQFWALQALRKVATADDSLANFLPELRDYCRKLAHGTDRARECRLLIDSIEAKIQHQG